MIAYYFETKLIAFCTLRGDEFMLSSNGLRSPLPSHCCVSGLLYSLHELHGRHQ